MDGEKTLQEKAKRQYGLISRRQALELGLSKSAIDRRLRCDAWKRFFPGVYRLAGTPDSDHQRVLGACLSLGPEAVASHRTAAALWGLDGFGAKLPDPLEVSAPRAMGALPGIVVHYPRSLTKAGRSLKLRIPTTHLARTLVDLATGVDVRTLERALDSAWRKRRNLPEWLDRYLQELGLRGRTGAHDLLRLARRRQARPTDSPLEVDVLSAIRAAGLPEPVLQYVISDARGFVARVDFAWPTHRVVLLADSWAHHHSRESFDHDHEQRERLAACGWTPVEVSARLVAHGSWIHALTRHLQRPRSAAPAPF